MPRLILIVGIVLLGGMLLRKLRDSGLFGSQNTFRPRQRPFRSGPASDTGPATFLVSRAELTGIRDSFSAEPIDPDRALMRCPGCQSYYHADSIKVLERENGGQCVTCQATHFDAVQVTA
ncbi:MAG: hypothetical protein ACRBC3_10520 [Burkholderiaceae bacterium]